MKQSLSLFLLVVLFKTNCFSQWMITSQQHEFSIDFDSSVPGINEGAFVGSGISPNPLVGQLNSKGISIVGFSDGDCLFEELKGPKTDFGRGISAGKVGSGGLYAFNTNTEVLDYALGIQSTGDDFTPGYILIKAQNKSGSVIHSLNLSYDIYCMNDQGRSSSFNFAFSSDQITFNPVTDIDYVSPEKADLSPSWQLTNKSAAIQTSLGVDEFFYLRWTHDDASGTGSRDELALDNIKLSFTSLVTNTEFIKDEFRITPNPCQNYLNWQSSKDVLSLRIFDIKGVLVDVIHQPTNQYVNITPLPSGYYLLQVVFVGGETELLKIIKH